MKNLDKYYKIATEVTQLAGNFLLDKYGSIKNMSHKSGTHYGIAEDVKCNKIYEKYLKHKTPEVSIYSEEGEKNLNSDLIWVIDPIDGTSNYRVGIPLFVTQICLLYKSDPVVSIIHAPIFKQFFSAQKNKGAFLNNKKLIISKTLDLRKAMLGVNKGGSNLDAGKYITQLGNQVRTVRIYGSMGIELAYVASGKLDILIDSGSDLYDYAPGVLLVKEAGGVVLNFEGKDWTFRDKTLLATNKKLASDVLQILKNK